MGSIVSILEAVGAQIAIESTRPINPDGTGGTTFDVEVLYGDENVDKLQSSLEMGRVVLTVGDGVIGPIDKMRASLRALSTWTPDFEAHLWAPIGPAGVRTSLLRWDAVESLVKVVGRSIYNAHYGSSVPKRNVGETIAVNRDAKKLRSGQSAVLVFNVSIPISEGRTLTTLPAGARGAVTVVANPNT